MQDLKKGINSIRKRVSTKHWVEQIVDDFLMSLQKEHRIGDEFHPSSAGKCPRLIQFSMQGIFYDKIEPRVQRIFDVGHDMHARYKRYFEGAKRFIQDEVPIRIEIDGIVIIGRADLTVKNLYDEVRLLELKTINLRRYNELLTSGTCIEDHFIQWNIYSKGLGISEGEIIYENKDDQRLKIFSAKYNDEKFWQIVNVFKMINNCNIKGLVVPKPSVCVDPRYCPAKAMCKEI